MSDPEAEVQDLLGLGEPIYNADEVIEAAEVDREFADRLWLAMGFAMLPRDQKAFTASDRDALKAVAAFERGGFAERDLILAITRVLSQSMARISDAQVGAMREWIWANATDEVTARATAMELAPDVVRSLEEFLVHIWRRHLSFAIERQELFGAPTLDEQLMSIGFADLVGFTQLSRHLDEPGLARIVERLESTSQELIADLGGRVVKSLGDEVMFAADSSERAAEIALRLVEEGATDEDLPDLRVGMAHGPVVAHRGDFFGATVNLASRAVDVALPGSVLVSPEMRDELKEHDAFFFKPIPARKLKGIGTTRLWVLRRSDA